MGPLGEKLWHLLPVVRHWLIVFENFGPQLAHLFFLLLGHIDMTLEIALISRLLCPIFASELDWRWLWRLHFVAIFVCHTIIVRKQAQTDLSQAMFIDNAELLASLSRLSCERSGGND